MKRKDVSEESDNEVPETTAAQSSKRRRPNTVKFKRNLNGEWPLHVACIKGNGKMVFRTQPYQTSLCLYPHCPRSNTGLMWIIQ